MDKSTFSVQLPTELLARFDAQVSENGENRNQAVRNLISEYVERNTAIVLGWLRVERQGEGEANECAGCAQELDWKCGVYAPLMSNGVVGSLHCAGCATHE